MNTRSRSIQTTRTDENEGTRAKNAVKTSTTTTNVVPQRRAALGDVGNRDGFHKDIVKNIKPRVDTHWKKNEPRSVVSNKVVTKTERVPSILGSKPPVAEAKGGKLKVTTTKPKAEVNHAGQQQPSTARGLSVLTNLRREESNVAKLKIAVLGKTKREKTEPKAVAIVQPLLKRLDAQCKITAHSSSLLDEVENIDANDSHNPLLVSVYANDIYSYLFHLETSMPIRKNHLDKQAEVSSKMRAVLLDWINEVHNQFRLLPETYHLTVSIIDRYLQKVITTQRHYLQLVGVAALFLASKYEELYPPEVADFIYIADDTYTKEQILSMERRIIRSLDFNLGRPSSIHFLRRFTKAANAVDETHMLAKYLIELVSVDYSFAHYRPSKIAAAALLLSVMVLNKKSPTLTEARLWTNTLQFYSTYTADTLRPLVKEMAKLLKNASKAQLKAVYAKYSSSKFDKIATQVDGNSRLERICSSP